MGSHPGGITSEWDQESQAGACFVFPLFTENIPRNLPIYSMENSTAFLVLQFDIKRLIVYKKPLRPNSREFSPGGRSYRMTVGLSFKGFKHFVETGQGANTHA